MRSSDALELVLAVEREWPVDTWRIDDVRIWPLLRVRIYTEALNQGLLEEQLPSASARLAGLVKRIARAQANVARAWWRDRRANARPRGPVDALMLSDGVSFVRSDGLWYDKFFDPIITWLQAHGSTYFMMTPMTEAHHPRRSASAFVQPRLDLVKTRASLVRRAPRAVQLEGFADAMRKVQALAPNAPVPDAGQLFVWWRRVQALGGYFDAVLARTRPARAFVNTWYSAEGMAFVLACRRRGVRVADVQHGVQGDQHVAYGRWTRVPGDGYELLPHEFWVWSAAEQRTIDSWRPANEHVAIVTGNAWLEVWREGRERFVAPAVASARALRRAAAARHVLVTLQWGLADEETLKILRATRLAGDAIEWWIRLHPLVAHDRSQIRKWVADLCGDNVQIDAPTDLPLHAVLQCADLHVTHSSSTVIEADEFGVGSVVTSDYGAQFFPQEIERGVAVLAVTDAEIARTVVTHAHPEPRSAAEERSGALAQALERALSPRTPEAAPA